MKTYINPIDVKGGDPFILLHNGMYYLYGTNSPDGFLVSSSPDMVNWRQEGFALHRDNAIGTEKFYAPEVIFHKGKFYMVYASNEHLALAVADSPLGPFTQNEKRYLNEKEREIDGHLFVDDDGCVYIYFVRIVKGLGNVLYGAQISDDFLSYKNAREILRAQLPWETVLGSVTEGPFMLKKDGLYYLMYTANDFRCKDYAVGYALSSSPLDGFTKHENNPILIKNGPIMGTGHNSVTASRDGRELFIVYHCHNSENSVNPRLLCIDRMGFEKDLSGKTVISVKGPTFTPSPYPSGCE